MILAILLISVGATAVIWRRDLLGGLVGIQLVSFGLASLAVSAAVRNGKPELGSWYGLVMIVGGLLAVSIGFALASRRRREPVRTDARGDG